MRISLGKLGLINVSSAYFGRSFSNFKRNIFFSPKYALFKAVHFLPLGATPIISSLCHFVAMIIAISMFFVSTQFFKW